MASSYIRTIAALGSLFYAGAAMAQSATPADIARLFVGVWQAIPDGAYAENTDGTKTYPFGQDAVVRLILTTDGYGANTLQSRDRGKCAIGTSPGRCTPQEAAAAIQSSSSYQFRYRIEPDASNASIGTMIWDVDLTVYPNWQGQSLTRRYEMSPDGSRLSLLAPFPSNPALGFRLHLQRMQP